MISHLYVYYYACTFWFTTHTEEEDANLVYKEMERLKAHYVKVAIHLSVPPDIVDDIKERDCSMAFNDVIKIKMPIIQSL